MKNMSVLFFYVLMTSTIYADTVTIEQLSAALDNGRNDDFKNLVQQAIDDGTPNVLGQTFRYGDAGNMKWKEGRPIIAPHFTLLMLAIFRGNSGIVQFIMDSVRVSFFNIHQITQLQYADSGDSIDNFNAQGIAQALYMKKIRFMNNSAMDADVIERIYRTVQK